MDVCNSTSYRRKKNPLKFIIQKKIERNVFGVILRWLWFCKEEEDGEEEEE